MEKHLILGDKVNLYKRGRSRFWQCSTYLQGQNHRTSTKEESLGKAKDFAKDWYFTLSAKDHYGEVLREKSFADAAKKFIEEYEIITEGQRSPAWVEGHKSRLRPYLLPFFGKTGLSKVTAGMVQDYRIHRAQNNKSGKPPARSTLHDEIVTLRQVLKTAVRHEWISHLPDISMPYKTQGKVVHRPWFSPKEYKQLYEATRRRAKNPGRQRDRLINQHWSMLCPQPEGWACRILSRAKPKKKSRIMTG